MFSTPNSQLLQAYCWLHLACCTSDLLSVIQVKDATQKKMKALEEAKEAVEAERDGLKSAVAR